MIAGGHSHPPFRLARDFPANLPGALTIEGSCLKPDSSRRKLTSISGKIVSYSDASPTFALTCCWVVMLRRPYEFKHLSDHLRESIRQIMLEELLWASRHGKVYASKYLTTPGLHHYPQLLQYAVANGSPDTLCNSWALQSSGGPVLQGTPLKLLPGTSSTNITCVPCAASPRIILSTRSSWSADANQKPIVALPTAGSTRHPTRQLSFSGCVFSPPSTPSARIPV